jgi:hypothetical protein
MEMKSLRLQVKLKIPGRPTAGLPAFIYIPFFPLLIPQHMFMRGMPCML